MKQFFLTFRIGAITHSLPVMSFLNPQSYSDVVLGPPDSLARLNGNPATNRVLDYGFQLLGFPVACRLQSCFCLILCVHPGWVLPSCLQCNALCSNSLWLVSGQCQRNQAVCAAAGLVGNPLYQISPNSNLIYLVKSVIQSISVIQSF